MRYAAKLKKEGKYILAEFPDCPGCQTFSGRGESIQANASDALVGWLKGFEHPDYNPTLETLEKVAEALGVHARFGTSHHG